MTRISYLLMVSFRGKRMKITITCDSIEEAIQTLDAIDGELPEECKTMEPGEVIDFPWGEIEV